jgi:hypothetical protein
MSEREEDSDSDGEVMPPEIDASIQEAEEEMANLEAELAALEREEEEVRKMEKEMEIPDSDSTKKPHRPKKKRGNLIAQNIPPTPFTTCYSPIGV